MEIAILFFVLVCIGIPVGSGIRFAVGRDGTFPSFMVGVAAFVVSQLLIRVPILQNVLPNFEWFLMLPYVAGGAAYVAFLALTAGIFEESARYVGFRVFRKGHVTWRDGLAFGLGHGGVEAAYIGVNGLKNLLSMDMTKELALSAVLSAFERCCAMTIQVGLTLVVLYGIRNRKKRFLLLAILLHGVVDFGVILQNAALLYGLLSVEAVLFFIWIIKSRKIWEKAGLKTRNDLSES